MRNKLILLLIMGLFALAPLASARCRCEAPQQRESMQKRMEEFFAQKKAYLIKEADLTDEEADAFFPLYNELQQKKFELNRDLREKLRRMEKKDETITDDAYLDAVNSVNDLSLREAQLDQEYYAKFVRVLPAKKLYKVQQAESSFVRNMMGKRPKPEK